MCGIAGIVTLDSFDAASLVSMTQVVKHRGPDGYGFAYFGPGPKSGCELIHNEERWPSFQKLSVGLGNRRLAILDLSPLGNQPMQIDDGALTITYNGEVYNYLEIRRELEAAGQTFRSRTDTEVILRGYQQWGSECLNRFNGMWAFAIWDRARQRLFCARDRFGVKPFYYALGIRCFLFGSEIKQILEFPGSRRTANDRIVFQYLEQNLLDHTEETFFKDVSQLPAGHYLTLDLSQGSLAPQIRRYWDLSLDQSRKLSVDEASDEFLGRFKKAVTLRMRSDVPVGSCLSGGLDSSAVVCMATKLCPGNDFHVFSSCFDDETHDEREYIREVVATTGVQSHLVYPMPEEFWHRFEKLIWHQDEPVGGASVYAQWCVMEQARRAGIPVLLDGQGGDETLCGYRKFQYLYLWMLLKKANPKLLAEALLWLRNGSRPLWSWEDAARYMPGFLTQASSLTARVSPPSFARQERHWIQNLWLFDGLSQRQKVDLVAYSIPALLHYEDRNSMAHSIEARVPFLDYELAAFLVNCPPSFKLRHGWSKWILRNAMKGILPEKIRLRKTKLGFGTPQAKWLRNELRKAVEDLLASSEWSMGRFLVRQKVQEEFTKFFAGHSKALPGASLLRALNLEMWGRVFGVS